MVYLLKMVDLSMAMLNKQRVDPESSRIVGRFGHRRLLMLAAHELRRLAMSAMNPAPGYAFQAWEFRGSYVGNSWRNGS